MVTLPTTCALFLAASSVVAAFSPSRLVVQKSAIHQLSPSSLRTPTSLLADSSLFPDGNNSNNNSNDFDDFAEFSSTQLASSSSITNDDTKQQGGRNSDSSDEDSFLSSLQSRVQQVQDQSNKLPLMILDTMLPRQILQIQIQHPTLKSLMKHRYRQETPTLGMLGMAKLSTGQTLPLKTGVEVEIIQMDKPTDVLPSDISNNGEEPWDISLRACRRFIIEGDVEKTAEGWTEAQIKFLDSSAEEENEINKFTTSQPSMEDPTGMSTEGDRLSVARAISKAKQFTQPNMNMKNSASLVERWIELAKQNERHPGQIDVLLKQLGEIPPEHEPTERALWIGALINPLPSMGVAMEIRPQLLVSKRAEERVQVALEGLLKSIKHMDGSARMW